jgi:hypothetical protein
MNKYRTRDFYLASFWVAKGVPLESHERAGGITTFVFSNKDEIEELIRSYFGFAASINPQLYGNDIRSLKSMIHSNANAERLTNSYVQQPGTTF